MALHSTVGRQKAEVLADRLRDINPAIGLTIVNRYIRDEETYTCLLYTSLEQMHQVAAHRGHTGTAADEDQLLRVGQVVRQEELAVGARDRHPVSYTHLVAGPVWALPAIFCVGL